MGGCVQPLYKSKAPVMGGGVPGICRFRYVPDWGDFRLEPTLWTPGYAHIYFWCVHWHKYSNIMLSNISINRHLYSYSIELRIQFIAASLFIMAIGRKHLRITHILFGTYYLWTDIYSGKKCYTLKNF